MATLEIISGRGVNYDPNQRTALASYTSPHPVIGGMLHLAQHGHAGAIHLMSPHVAILGRGMENGGGSIGYGTSVPHSRRHGAGLKSFLGKIIRGIGNFFNSNIPNHLVNIGKSVFKAGNEIAPEIQAIIDRKRARDEGTTAQQ